ncbi:MAG: tripartite tricarboxylate transporter substrate binding protein [Betaproteobacteria bacterium]|nr:tripartite tricarboxylate transporter substrate binding protein [Betaproteobacteria bacterium]PWB58172.1 MAG: LacI family transcriptional regulator [Betaproteobacteria bacterium]
MDIVNIRNAVGLIATAALLAAMPAAAQGYPERTITMVVPFGAGGSTDIVGRIAADAMSKVLGVSIIIENKGGAGGTVGTQAAANAAPDGYTITMSTTSTHVVGPLTVDTVKYNPVKDFEHVGMIAETPYVLVISPKLAVNSVKELIDYAKKNPGKLNYGSAGHGSTTHLAALMFLNATGTDMLHVPYKSNAESTKAVLTDEVQVLFGSMPAVLGQIKGGAIRALAVGTTSRSPELPNVATMQEAGVAGYRASLWLGISAPARTPAAVVNRLNAALGQVLADPAVAKRLLDAGAEPSKMTPAEFAKLISSELDVYGKIVAGMKK